jgi:hypothetical protein
VADQRDVRRIARSLPGVREEEGRFAFNVENKGRPKGFAWVWLERIEPKKARVPNPDVIVDAWRCQAPKHLARDGAASVPRKRASRRRVPG